jgi:hypothetical protein
LYEVWRWQFGVCEEQEVRECPAKRETGGHRDVVFGVYLEQ